MENVMGCALATPDTCAIVPDENASYMGGGDISPEFSWSGVPAGTRSFALTLTDLTYGQPHWAVWNLPGDLTLLAANVPKMSAELQDPAGAVQSNATFAEGEGYFGPQAPCNVFEFELFALSSESFAPTQPDYVAVVRSELQAREDILGRATLIVRTNQPQMCE